MCKKLCLVLITFFLCMHAQAQQQSMTFASFNMRYDSQDDAKAGNGWKQRFPMIGELVKFYNFDIFGGQEILHHQLQDLKKVLPGYAAIGVGRDDGKQAGEYSPIFYKEDQYKLLKQGVFWLAEDTEKPAKGWDAALPRICTWAQFEDKRTGRAFYFFNTHFDHVGVEARKKSSQLIARKVKEMAGDLPAVLTGDFNVDQTNEGYTVMNESGIMEDAHNLAKVVYEPNGTFNSFDMSRKTDKRIDHIFVTSQFNVERYGILTDSFGGRFPSDHFPVMVKVQF